MEIQTERLILRKAKKNDWQDILEGASDLNVSKNMTTVPYPYGKDDAENFLLKKNFDPLNLFVGQ